VKEKLYRSRSDAMVGGVCGGLGQYLGIDSNLVRLIFALLAVANGIGVLIYLLLWLIVPREGEAKDATAKETIRTGAGEIAEKARALGDELRTAVRHPDSRAGVVIGGLLILLGVIFLLQNLGIFWLRWLGFDVLWPLVLIAIGVALLWRRLKGG